MSRESHHDAFLKVQRTLTAWLEAVAQPADETYGSDSARRIGEPVAISGDGDGFLEDLKFALHPGRLPGEIKCREFAGRVNGEVVYRLRGRMDRENIAESESLIMAEGGGKSIVLDLKDITLAGRDNIDYLARCEAADIKLSNCPPHIREWITRQVKKGESL